MEKKLFNSLLLLITFTILLILVIVKFDAIWSISGNVIAIFTPLFIGLAIAFVLNRPCAFFKRQLDKLLGRTKLAGVSTILAVAASYFVLFAVVTAIFSFVLPQLVASAQLFAASLEGYLDQAQVWLNEIVEKFHLAQLDLTKLDDIIKKMVNGAIMAVTNAVPQIFTFTSGVITVIVTAVLAFVFSIYMLAGKDRLLGQCRRMLKAYVPNRVYEKTLDVIRLTADTFAKFVTGQVTEACIIGGLCFAGMVILRLDYAPLIGMMVGVSALIPIVGAYVGATLSALLLVMISPVKAITFLIFLVALQQFEGNVIYPRIVGTSLGLPGIWVLTAVTVGGGLFGFLGMLLSVPVASICYILLRRDIHARLTKEVPEEKEESGA